MNRSNPKRNIIRSEANFCLTKIGDRESLQNTSPSPQEEVALIVGQKTDGSSARRHEKVRQRQIDDDVIERLSELLEPEGDQHHREVLAQRHRGHYEHQRRQDAVVPGRDGGERCQERILGVPRKRLHQINQTEPTSGESPRASSVQSACVCVCVCVCVLYISSRIQRTWLTCSCWMGFI